MDNINIKLHEYQKLLLKTLALKPFARFNELLIEGLESEHMNYHLQKLMELEFVSKTDTHYMLSDKGKDYSNLMDDNVEIIEKQPKTSVLLRIVRKSAETGETEHLLCKRLRQPYLGKIGKLTGKVRFGETLVQAAERELYEETGLSAKEVILENVYHKLRYRDSGGLDDDKTFIQDVLFYCFFVSGLSGSLIEKTPHQENFWITKKEANTRSDLDFFDSYVFTDTLTPDKLTFIESVAAAEGF